MLRDSGNKVDAINQAHKKRRITALKVCVCFLFMFKRTIGVGVYFRVLYLSCFFFSYLRKRFLKIFIESAWRILLTREFQSLITLVVNLYALERQKCNTSKILLRERKLHSMSYPKKSVMFYKRLNKSFDRDEIYKF